MLERHAVIEEGPDDDTEHERTVLYRFFDADGSLLYVGITKHVGQRWSWHMRNQPWWQEVHRLTAEWHDTREDASVAEIAAIKSERPAYNVAHVVHPVVSEAAQAHQEAATRAAETLAALHAAIVIARKQGASMKQITSITGYSAERIRQIVKTAEKENDDDA